MSVELRQAGMIYPPLIIVETSTGSRYGFKTELDGNGNLTEALRKRVEKVTAVALGLRAFGLPEALLKPTTSPGQG